MLNTIVSDISYNNNSVTITNTDGSCIHADYAINTFSLGVLKNDLVTFNPPLPSWKDLALASFEIGTYTKIFLQFPPDRVFWNTSTQFFLYADPSTRGWYPLFQSLDTPGFLPGSGILFVTVVTEQSYMVDNQPSSVTKAQIMEVLYKMFGKENVPDPTDFMYPRWSTTPWAMGSYSNWPPGTTLEMHQNLRANVGRVWFAGEATSAQFYGWLHGAWTEGQAAGMQIAECLKRKLGTNCKNGLYYDVLTGTTEVLEYSGENGWLRNSFATWGLETRRRRR